MKQGVDFCFSTEIQFFVIKINEILDNNFYYIYILQAFIVLNLNNENPYRKTMATDFRFIFATLPGVRSDSLHYQNANYGGGDAIFTAINAGLTVPRFEPTFYSYRPDNVLC